MANETELKYAPIAGFSADALFDDEYILPFRGQIKSIDMHTDYLDTPNGDASALGITLRRRFENGESVIYAKCSRKSDGGAFTVRGEWSVSSCDIQNAAALLLAEGAPTEKLCGLPLGVCASVKFRRRECTVAPCDGFSFVLSYDTGHFGGRVPFSEIELELAEGSEEELIAFGKRLAERLSLIPEPLSKYARAKKYGK